MVLTWMVTIDRGLASDLLKARPGVELFAEFQPQVDLLSGAIVSAEVLCRWRHPQLGLVGPDQFIPLSEETGSIQNIGRFVLEEGLDALEAWGGRDGSLTVSVNVSPVQLTTDDFVEHVCDQVERRRVAPGALTIEITESRPLAELHGIVGQLERLRAWGVGVALDDFGTGHASQADLERLPLTEVKLDRSLIQADEPQPPSELLDAVHSARDRRLLVVAEGIETPLHLARARALGCDLGQGYLLGRPMSREALAGVLAP